MLEEHGVCTVAEGEQADICLINTCTVTETANSKCRQQIRKMVRENPQAVVIVTGCYAQLSPKEVAGIEGVDLIVGSNEKGEILQFLADRLQWNCSFQEGGCVRAATELQLTRKGDCGDSCDRASEGYSQLCAIVLARRAYALLAEGAGRVRLLLHVLCYSLCTRQ